MKITDCIEAMINLELDAMVWEIDNCLIEELLQIYEFNGTETHIVITKPENEYLINRMRWSSYPNELGPPAIILKLHEEYYCYIITTDDEKTLANKAKADKANTTDDLPL